MHGCTYYMLVLMCVWLMCVVQFEVSWFFYQEFTGAGQVSSTCLWFTRTDNTTITLLSRSQIKHKHFTPHTSPLPTMPWEWKRVIIRVTCVCTVWYVRSFVVASYVFTCMSNLAVLCRQTSLKLSSGNVSLPMLQMQFFSHSFRVWGRVYRWQYFEKQCVHAVVDDTICQNQQYYLIQFNQTENNLSSFTQLTSSLFCSMYRVV